MDADTPFKFGGKVINCKLCIRLLPARYCKRHTPQTVIKKQRLYTEAELQQEIAKARIEAVESTYKTRYRVGVTVGDFTILNRVKSKPSQHDATLLVRCNLCGNTLKKYANARSLKQAHRFCKSTAELTLKEHKEA